MSEIYITLYATVFITRLFYSHFHALGILRGSSLHFIRHLQSSDENIRLLVERCPFFSLYITFSIVRVDVSVSRACVFVCILLHVLE